MGVLLGSLVTVCLPASAGAEAWSCELPADVAGDPESFWAPEGMPVGQPRDVVRRVDPHAGDLVDLRASRLSLVNNSLTITMTYTDLAAVRPLHGHGDRAYVMTWHVPSLDDLPMGLQPLYVTGVRALYDLDGWTMQWRRSRNRGWEEATGTLDASTSSLAFTIPWSTQVLGTRITGLDIEAFVRSFSAASTPGGRTDIWGGQVALTTYDHSPFYDPDVWLGWPSWDVDLGGACYTG